jgi:hypothetical protein
MINKLKMQKRKPIFSPSDYDLAIYKNGLICHVASNIKEASDFIGCNEKYLYKVLRSYGKVKGYEIKYTERSNEQC